MWIICRGRQRLAHVGKLQLPQFAALPHMQKIRAGRAIQPRLPKIAPYPGRSTYTDRADFDI